MNSILNVIFEAIVFFLPAYIANALPVLGHGINSFKNLYKFSIDGGRKIGDSFIFGSHKTWFGFFIGVVGTEVIFVFLNFGGFNWLLEKQNLFTWPAVMALGALSGDLLKSFIKRRLGIAAGRPWIPFDQIDFIIGAWLCSGFYFKYENTWNYLVIALIITPLLHLLANFFAYKLKLKSVWW